MNKNERRVGGRVNMREEECWSEKICDGGECNCDVLYGFC